MKGKNMVPRKTKAKQKICRKEKLSTSVLIINVSELNSHHKQENITNWVRKIPL